MPCEDLQKLDAAGDRGLPGANRRVAPDGGVYAALDLGTNNCRLLVAIPRERGFRVIDAFSKIVRLGEGIGHTGRLADGAAFLESSGPKRGTHCLDNAAPARNILTRSVSRSDARD